MSGKQFAIVTGAVARPIMDVFMTVTLWVHNGLADPVTALAIAASALELTAWVVCACFIKASAHRLLTYMSLTGVAWLVMLFAFIFAIVSMVTALEEDVLQGLNHRSGIMVFLGLLFVMHTFCFGVGAAVVIQSKCSPAAEDGLVALEEVHKKPDEH
ncbi:hypothetical protein BV898_02817 [Hypsibius exemplaris]|uniref:Uncharacterized protein n=1 Tax=Hypsibius exemplaris TaxID=2072580 RepID=A0A1W0X7Y2_HYPEX|nr:hypothetical protein BV898_02817 [Hypsibius exemplaris]